MSFGPSEDNLTLCGEEIETAALNVAQIMVAQIMRMTGTLPAASSSQ